MAGPGLTGRESHHAIHQAAFAGAERLTRLLRQAVGANKREEALYLTGVLIEYWQTHTLPHAEAEETGWYREIIAMWPDRQVDVMVLTRDHELLRILLAEIQGILAVRGMTSGIVERFEAMLLINSIHNREEERRLLSEEAGAGDQHPPGEVATPVEAVPPPLQGESHGETIPLAVARPALHAQLLALLRTRGLHSADLQASIRYGANGPLLHVIFGRTSSPELEWQLPPESDPMATAELLARVVELCEAATKEDYYAFMRLIN
jgi:hypothetical protein